MTFDNEDHPRGHPSNKGSFTGKVARKQEIGDLSNAGSLLAQQILIADDDERERLVDGATDAERAALADHDSADIRHLVARSPETDVDTLDTLSGDADPDVAAAAEHSLG